MKRYLLPIFMILLILATTTPGYCYTNTVAKKTNVPNSEYDSLIQKGMSTGTKIGLGTGAVLGAGAAAGIGTYVVIQVTSSAIAMPAASTTYTALLSSGTLALMEANAAWLGSSASGTTAAAGGASVASVAAPFLAAAGVAAVVMVVTATGIFIVWTVS